MIGYLMLLKLYGKLTYGRIEGHLAAANPLSPGPLQCPQSMNIH